MKLKKILLAFASIALLVSAAPQTASAQWSLGASYEIRNEEPKNGFGARIEREILGSLPLVNLGIRAHFSYFSDENNVDYSDGSVSYSYSQDVTNYDYGLAAVGGVTVGPINPYVGLGLGATSLDVSRSDLPNNSAFDGESSDSAIYWNGFVGAKLSALPIQPFVEYRLEDVSNYEEELRNVQSSNGRMIFGVSLSF
jgi:hypothetical protein